MYQKKKKKRGSHFCLHLPILKLCTLLKYLDIISDEIVKED